MSAKLDVGLYLDVEDYFHPPEAGSDDIIKQFAEALDAENLRANFLFIAVRAKLLQTRGRREVIQALARHAIGLHTLTAEHPCLPEYTAGKDWDTAVARAREYEARGWEILREVFGRDPVCISAHAQYAAPYTFPVAKEFGVPHVYGYPAAPPLYSLSWYAGALNVPYAELLRQGIEILSYFEFGDENYADEAGFEEALRALERRIEACLANDQPYLTLFVCHPYHLRYIEFTDYWQYINGENIPQEEWGKRGGPRRRTEAQMEVAWRNVRRLFRYIARHDALNVLTLPEIQAKYGQQPATIERADLLAAAQVVTRGPRPGFEAAGWYKRDDAPVPEVHAYGRYSAGELAVGWATALQTFAQNGSLPREVPRVEVLGPKRNPILIPEVWQVGREAFSRLVSDFCEHVKRTGHLPHTLGDPGERVGLGSLYRALAETYLTAAYTNTFPETIVLPPYPRFPSIAKSLGYLFLDIADNEIIHPDLEHYNLIRDAKLQTWTLKSAIPSIGM